jgi:uncharacterized membrane protein YgcG
MSDDVFDSDLRARLRVELDRVRPPHSAPRYLTARGRPLALRLVPAALAASLLAVLALSGFFATGSTNPVVWGQRVVTVLEPQTAAPSPTPEQDHHKGPATRPSESPEREHQSPGPQPSAEPRESPEPADDHSGSGTSGSGSSGSGSSGTSGSDSHSGSGSGDSPDPTSDSGDVERS